MDGARSKKARRSSSTCSRAPRGFRPPTCAAPEAELDHSRRDGKESPGGGSFSRRRYGRVTATGRVASGLVSASVKPGSVRGSATQPPADGSSVTASQLPAATPSPVMPKAPLAVSSKADRAGAGGGGGTGLVAVGGAGSSVAEAMGSTGDG